MEKKLVAVLMALLTAGCVGGGPAAQVVLTPAPQVHNGSILGAVMDDEARPVEGAVLTLVEIGELRVTGADGSFSFDDILHGNYTLVLTHPEYPAEERAALLHESDLRVNFTITKLPEFQPYHITTPFVGNYDCAGEYLIITGDCGILFEYASCQVDYCTSDPAFAEKYQFPFDVNARWQTLVAELTWTTSPASGLAGMRMYVEHANESTQGQHGKKVARVDGAEQPLTIRIERGEVRPEADVYNGTEQKAFIPDEGGPQQIRVFPMGQGWDYTRTVCEPTRGCFLGVGAGLSVQFTAYVTLFYNEAAPADFSAVPE